MKTVNILIGLAVAAVAFTSCQEAKSPDVANAVYIADASTSNAKKIATDEFGGSTTMTARVANFMGNNVYFDWKVDQAALDAYNAKNETSYTLLPATYYDFDKSFDTVKMNQTSSKPLTVTINPMDDLPASVKYAIPVVISNVKGGSVLESSSSLVIIIDRVIITDVLRVSAYSIKMAFTEAQKMNNVQAWTAEFLLKPERLISNNQALYGTSGPAATDEVYSRFGDVVIRKTQMQVKTQGMQPNTNMDFTTNKWYHVAFVYNGGSFKIVIDGKADVTVPSPTINYGYSIHSMFFGGATKAQVAEIRLWTLARTEAQLIDSKYAVDPQTPGLKFYLKCDEGTGTVVKDATGNGYDGIIESGLNAPDWIKDVRFPDTM